jgi:hypothetical protein
MQDAYKLKDAEAVGDLYEDDAIFANTDAGWTAVGRAELVERFKEMFTISASTDGVPIDSSSCKSVTMRFRMKRPSPISSSRTEKALDVAGRGTTVPQRHGRQPATGDRSRVISLVGTAT